MTQISLSLLENDPRNSNVCTPEVLEKLQRHIERTGFYPPLIVRPHPKHPKRFIIIDGHHRKQVLASLGHTEAQCIIWSLSETEAQIALATLNTLHGTENLRKRAELVQSLTQILPVPELAQLLPETEAGIQDLLALLDQDTAALEQALQDQMTEEKATLPIPFTFLVATGDAPQVQQALAHFENGRSDRGDALVALCEFALKQLEMHYAESQSK